MLSDSLRQEMDDDMREFRQELLQRPADPPRRERQGIQIGSVALEGALPNNQPKAREIEQNTSAEVF